MRPQMEAMIEELRSTENKDQLVELENKMATVLGGGFMKGEFSYNDMQEIKDRVEQIEAERRQQFELPEVQRNVKHVR